MVIVGQRLKKKLLVDVCKCSRKAWSSLCVHIRMLVMVYLKVGLNSVMVNNDGSSKLLDG